MYSTEETDRIWGNDEINFENLYTLYHDKFYKLHVEAQHNVQKYNFIRIICGEGNLN